MNINRRTLLKTATLGSIGYLASKFPTLAQSTLPSPKLLNLRRPEAGLVEADLVARTSNLTLNGKPVQLLTYGGFPGPTLRVKEGDTLRLNFTNNLSESTNLHLHGLHMSPSVDNPLAEILPGHSRMYEFTLPKGSAGTHWYHPHLHGKVAEQLYAGLAGMLVVEGPLDAMDELRQAEEHTLVLKDWLFSGNQIPAWTRMDWMNGREGNLLTVNGALRPTLRAQKATLRLRVLNASNARYYRLALENHPLYLIGTDGGFVEKPVELPELLLAPGERADLLVRLTREGNYRLQSLPYDRGRVMVQGMGEMMDQGMGGMDHGDGMQMPMTSQDNRVGRQGTLMAMGASPLETLLTITAPSRPQPLPLPTGFASIERLDPSKATANRRIKFGEWLMQADFYVNSKKFDHSRVDIKAKVGSLEVWELVGNTDMDHPFHLHTYSFQVISRNGIAAPYRAWRDMVNLKKNDVVRIAVPLRDFTGITVYHCHILEHEDRGMMGVLEVTA